MSTDRPDTATSQEAEVEEIATRIEHTRSEMGATLGALERRLRPAELGEQAKEQLEQLEARAKALVKEGLDEAKVAVSQGLADARESVKKDIHAAIATTKHAVREATIGRVENLATQAGDVMNDTRDTLIETVRRNPIPAALAGIGIAWLLMNRSSSKRRQSEAAHHVGSALGSAGSAVTGAAHDASQAVSGVVAQGVDVATQLAGQVSATARHLAHDATDATGRLLHGATDTAGQLANQAGEQAMRVERAFESTLKTNPLAIGAVAAAVGAAVGYSLPRTRKEDELMGELRDRVLHGATDLAHDATRSLHQLGDQAGEAAKKALSATQ
jgi:gas vesicle protein